jgi:hypothetical protein
MSNNRDEMHAAAGAMFTKQVNAEKAGSTGMAMGVYSEAKKPQNRGPRVVLNMKDDFRLTQWLHQREPVYNEQPADIFAQALIALVEPSIEGLNVDHIKTRLAAFADSLPKAKGAPLSVEQRLERLEHVVDAILKPHLVGGLNDNDLSLMHDFLNRQQ